MTLPAESIVKTLNVIKHVRFGVLSAGIDVALDSLFLSSNEGLDNCVSLTLASAAHTGRQLVVLTPTVNSSLPSYLPWSE